MRSIGILKSLPVWVFGRTFVLFKQLGWKRWSRWMSAHLHDSWSLPRKRGGREEWRSFAWSFVEFFQKVLVWQLIYSRGLACRTRGCCREGASFNCWLHSCGFELTQLTICSYTSWRKRFTPDATAKEKYVQAAKHSPCEHLQGTSMNFPWQF